MKKKEIAAALAVLAAVSALCLKGVERIDKKMKAEKEKKSH